MLVVRLHCRKSEVIVRFRLEKLPSVVKELLVAVNKSELLDVASQGVQYGCC